MSARVLPFRRRRVTKARVQATGPGTIAEADILSAGVYLAPWLTERGGRILVAIDSRGRMVGEERLAAGESYSEATLRLLDILDAADSGTTNSGRPLLTLLK